MPNVVRPSLTVRMNGSPSAAMKGDSLTFPFVSNRISGSIKARWPKNYGGETVHFLNNGDTGQAFSGFLIGQANVPLSLGVSGGGMRPGDAFPDGTSGHNITRTACLNFTGNSGDFGAFGQIVTYPTNPYEANWEANKSIRLRALSRAKTLSPNSWNIRGRQRAASGNASNQTDSGFEFLRLQTNAPNDFYTHPWVVFPRLNGSVSDHIAHVSSWNETEVSGWALEILAIQVELETQNNSIRWMYFGEGGFTSKMHLAAGQIANIGGFGNVLFRYSDAALAAHFALGEVDTVFYMVGQNNADDEWNGTTIGAYEQNMRNNIARDRAVIVAQGRVPMFVLISTYDTDNANTRFVEMANALQRIAESMSDVHFVDVRGAVQAQYGNYSSWSASLTTDGIHPNLTLSNFIADYIWTAMMNPNVLDASSSLLASRRRASLLL